MYFWQVCKEKYHSAKSFVMAEDKANKEIDNIMWNDGYTKEEIQMEIYRQVYSSTIRILSEQEYKNLTKQVSRMIRK